MTWNPDLEGRVVHRLHFDAATMTLTHSEHRVDGWNDTTQRLTFAGEQCPPEALHQGLKYTRLGQFNRVGKGEYVVFVADLRATDKTIPWLNARLNRLYRKGTLTSE